MFGKKEERTTKLSASVKFFGSPFVTFVALCKIPLLFLCERTREPDFLQKATKITKGETNGASWRLRIARRWELDIGISL